MAKPTGLSFENPLYQDASGVPSAVVNPFGFQNAAAASGSDALRDDLSSLAMMGGMGVQLARQNQFTMPEMKQPPSIGYSPSRKEIFVQGTTFAADDAQSILQAEGLLGGSPTGLPTEGDWVPLDAQAYGQLVKSVRQPTLGALAAKNFGRGVDVTQMLAGRGLQLAGAEELGGRIVSQQMQDLAKTAPYERQFTDIESGRGAVEWLVANFAQQGPNMIESIATAGLGFLAGTASSGTPIGGAAAAFSSLLGKSAWKESVKAALAKQARGEALGPAQQKLLREAAGIAGAVTASYAQNLATGAADIYGELREQGADANDVNARLTALAGAVPYAALETLPEFLLAGRVLTGVGAPTPMGVGITARQRGKELLKRGAVGGAVGGLAEGTTELSQEALLLGLSDQDFGSPENVDRLINSFAAGFGIGGPVGAAANLRGREATNLLNTAQSAEPTPGTGLVPVQPTPPVPTAGGPGTAVEPYYAPATFAGTMPTPPAQLAGPTTVPQLPGAVPPVTPMGGPYYVGTPEGGMYQDVMLRQQGNVPPGAPGTQGVLDIFGGQISAQELASRMQPPVEQLALPAPPAAVSPAQGALQFAGPAPAAGPVNTQMANQLQAIQARVQRQREFEAAQAQQQAAVQQQMDILAQQSQNARDLYAMQQAQQAAAVQPTMPMRETGPVAPRQLELFTRRQAPRPSRAEGLRRGVGVQVPPVTGETPLTPAQQRAQLSLFTREGQPTVAALKAAGVKTKVAPVPAKAPVVKPRTQRGLKKQAGVAAVEIVPKEKPSAAQKGKLKQSRVEQRAEDNEGVRAGRDVGQQPPTQVPAGRAEAGGRGVALKRGAQPEKVTKEAPPPKKPEAVPAAPAPVEVEPLPPAEVWEDMKPEGAPAFADLPPAVRTQWAKDVAAGKATVPRAAEILGESEQSPTEIVQDAIYEYESNAPAASRLEALKTIVYYAFFVGRGSNEKPAAAKALAYFESLNLRDSERGALNAHVVASANEKSQREARFKGGEREGEYTPWFSYVMQNGLLNQINVKLINLSLPESQKFLADNQLRTANLPDETIRLIKARAPELVLGEAGANLNKDTRANPASTLAQKIKDINSHTGMAYSPTARNNAIKRLRELWTAVQAAGMQDFIDQSGVPLSDYFDDEGNPYTGRVKGQFRVATEEITAEVRTKRETLIDEGAMAEDDSYESPFNLDSWNIKAVDDSYGDGRFFRDDGTPITKAIPMGRIKILVNTFLNKLGVKPNVFIYRDQADFKAKNPSLYAKAVASRPQGDFDTASAVGYSFGDGNVIIFSNRVATEQQLKFVLAHETLGHFGFRGLMTERELNVALDAVYNSSAKVRNAVETAMQARGMSKREAVEEYLADFAGTLDTNIIAKFWNAIKNALNKLGMRFDDDMARYLVSQSRRYVRNGAPSSSFVDFKAMAQRIAAIEGIDDPDGSGRFSVNAEYYDEYNRVLGQTAFGRRSMSLFEGTEVLQRAKDIGVRLADYGDRLIGELKTMNFASRENLGYRALYELYRDTSKKASQLRAQYNKLMETVLSPAVELPGIGKVGEGATEEQIAQTSRMLRAVNSARFATLSDAELRRMGALIKIVDGKAQIDQDVYKALDARGRATLDEFKKGFSYTDYVSRPATEEYRDTLRAERDALLAAAVDAKDRDNITKEYDTLLKEPSMSVAVTRTFGAMPDLTEKSLEWIMYNEVRDAMNQSAIDLLLANFTAAREMRVNVERKAAHFLDKVLSEQDKAFLGRVADKFLDLYNTGAKTDDSGVTRFDRDAMRNAEKFIAEFNTALLGRGTDLNKNVQEFFDAAEADDVFNGIEALKAGAKIKRDSKETKFMVQQAIANLATSEERRSGAEVFAKQTIAGDYVPFGREGPWQVRVQAVDPDTGRIYKVADEYRERLFFAQVANRAEALRVAEDAQRLFDSVEDGVEMEVFDGNEYVIKRVKLRAQPETSRETVSTTSEANLNEIIAAITRFSISITPEERERLVQGLTRQNSNARSRLRRAGTPGEDPNTIKYVSKHLESTAATVARKENRHRLDRLFDEADPDSKALWYGDEVEYNRRKAAWEAAQKNPNMPEAQRLAAKREYEDYHYTFITKNAREMGNRYKDRGRRLVAFMESQTDVDHTDFASGEVASLLRSGTTFAFMGASFATAILNYLSLATNVLPAFSGYNQKNAFGGGFGWGQSSIELTRATKDAAGLGQSETKFWDDLLADPEKLKASGFTEVEARFMQKEVSGGTMQAALTNSLLGSARGKFTSGAAKKAAETWMSLFNYTEQHSRRATGLAAFRLAYARALREGKDAATAFEVADKFAVDMIDNTLGDYAMYNRPAMFRGDVRQFLFMYKMFPVNTIQMLKALPRKEQLLALGILAMFAGLKGLPFAEDLMDLIDTIAQGLGLGPSALWKGSAERTLAEALDAIAPGMTPVLMKGLLNVITPANVADRVSLSNIVPGTGIALAGADVGRELIEIMGPMASFLQGAVVTSADIAKYGLETVGVLPDTTSINGILRESPVAMFRALGDMWAYNNAGAIVSQKGYVVSEDLHLGTMLTRALGFYPAAATAENDVVRLAKRVGDYQKDIAATYRGMYISAKIAKDNERAREVVQMARDWNENAKGSGLELRNFEAGANRALREAQRPATERFLRTQPLAVRPATEDMLRMYGVGEE